MQNWPLLCLDYIITFYTYMLLMEKQHFNVVAG